MALLPHGANLYTGHRTPTTVDILRDVMSRLSQLFGRVSTLNTSFDKLREHIHDLASTLGRVKLQMLAFAGLPRVGGPLGLMFRSRPGPSSSFPDTAAPEARTRAAQKSQSSEEAFIRQRLLRSFLDKALAEQIHQTEKSGKSLQSALKGEKEDFAPFVKIVEDARRLVEAALPKTSSPPRSSPPTAWPSWLQAFLDQFRQARSERQQLGGFAPGAASPWSPPPPGARPLQHLSTTDLAAVLRALQASLRTEKDNATHKQLWQGLFEFSREQALRRQLAASSAPPLGFGRRAAGWAFDLTKSLQVGLKDFFTNKNEQGRTANDRLRTGLVRSLAVATDVGGSLLKTASPDTFDLVTNSFKLLAAEIGQSLIPVAVKLAVWLQELAQGYANLAPNTKALIGTVVTWSTVLVAGVAAFSKLISVLSVFGAKLGGTLGVLGSLGGLIAYHYIQGQINRDQYQAAREKSQTVAATSSEKLLQEIPASTRDILDIADPAIRKFQLEREKQRLQQLREQHQRELNELKASYSPENPGVLDEITDFYNRYINNPIQGAFQKAPTPIKSQQAAALQQKVLSESAGLEVVERTLAGGSGAVGAGSARSRGQAASQLLAMFSLRAQPQYLAVEEAARQTQLDVLGKSPIEQELLRKQLEAQLLEVELLGQIAGLNAEQIRAIESQYKVSP
jgi:hypothetical protein